MAVETLFLAIFDPRSSIVKSVFDCHLSGVYTLKPIKTASKFKPNFTMVCGHIFHSHYIDRNLYTEVGFVLPKHTLIYFYKKVHVSMTRNHRLWTL